MVNDYPVQLSNLRTITIFCKLTLLSAMCFTKWDLRSVSNYVLLTIDYLLRAIFGLDHTILCSSPERISFNDYYRLLNFRDEDTDSDFRLFYAPWSRVLIIETVVCNSISSCSLFIFFNFAHVPYMIIPNRFVCLDRKSQFLIRTISRLVMIRTVVSSI